jgi:hypothetical protein
LRALGSLEITAPPVDLELLEVEPLTALVVPLDCDAGALGIFELLVFAGVALDALVRAGDALEELALVASFVLFVAFIFELVVFAKLVAESTGPLAVTVIVAFVFDGLPADLRKLSLLEEASDVFVGLFLSLAELLVGVDSVLVFCLFSGRSEILSGDDLF